MLNVNVNQPVVNMHKNYHLNNYFYTFLERIEKEMENGWRII